MELLKRIEETARQAGQIMLTAENIDAMTDEKTGHANFVTKYDRKVQEFCLRNWHASCPRPRS